MALGRQRQQEAKRRKVDLTGRVVSVPGDGDCFFHALSVVLKNAGQGQCNAQGLRSEGIQYMRAHQDRFAPFCAPSNIATDVTVKGYSFTNPVQSDAQRFADYCNVMDKPGTWADQTIILALAEKYNVAIEVHTPQDGLSYTVTNAESQSVAKVELRLQGSHYDALLPAPVKTADPVKNTTPAISDGDLAKELAIVYATSKLDGEAAVKQAKENIVLERSSSKVFFAAAGKAASKVTVSAAAAA